MARTRHQKKPVARWFSDTEDVLWAALKLLTPAVLIVVTAGLLVKAIRG